MDFSITKRYAKNLALEKKRHRTKAKKKIKYSEEGIKKGDKRRPLRSRSSFNSRIFREGQESSGNAPGKIFCWEAVFFFLQFFFLGLPSRRLSLFGMSSGNNMPAKRSSSASTTSTRTQGQGLFGFRSKSSGLVARNLAAGEAPLAPAKGR